MTMPTLGATSKRVAGVGRIFAPLGGCGVRGVVNRDVSRYVRRAIVGNPRFQKYRDAQKAPWDFFYHRYRDASLQ